MPNKLEDIELRSEEVQEILNKVPNWMIRWGNVLFLSLIVMVLVLTWFVKYPDVIGSAAVITTDVPPQKEYAKITGTIDTLLVENNESVSANQPLSIFENTANYGDVYFLKSIVDTVKINTSSFTFPIDSIPGVLFLGDIDSDYALFENTYRQYLLNKELQPFANQSIADQISLYELKKRLANLQSQREFSRKGLELDKKDLDRSETLFNKGVISEVAYETKQSEYLLAESNFNNINASISQIREAIGNANRSAQGTEFNQTMEEMTLLKGVIQSFNQLKKSIRDWELRYVLQSRIDGRVSFLDVWSQNQTVNQGALVFTIIPENNSSFIAKLKAPAQNSGKIKVGQAVNIKLESYPDTEFGTLGGKVASISSIPDEDGFYRIDVSLEKDLITSYDKAIEFRQEMSGFAEIITEDLRLIERFFYQFKELIDR